MKSALKDRILYEIGMFLALRAYKLGRATIAKMRAKEQAEEELKKKESEVVRNEDGIVVENLDKYLKD